MAQQQLKDFIPPHFNIKNYDTAHELDLKGWHHNLCGRAFYRKFVNANKGSGEACGILDNFFDQGILKPQVSLSLLPFSRSLGAVTSLSVFDSLEMSGLAEQDNEIRVLVRDYSNLKTGLKSLSKEAGVLRRASADRYLKINHGNSEGNHDYIGMARVDLSYSDKEINKMFLAWLAKEREIHPQNSNEPTIPILSSSQLQKWASNKVLAYLDLIAWNEAQGNRPTCHNIGQILFPEESERKDGGRSYESLIHKTVAPLAEKLISDSMFKRMELTLRENKEI